MTSLPVWIQVLQALLAPAIAVAVGVIAFFQWRTAHQKVMLDLFDRRLKIYEVVANTVFQYIDDPYKMTSSQALSLLGRAEMDAKFLFGEDVAPQILEYSNRISDHRRAVRRSALNNITDDERSKAIDAAADIDDELSAMLPK